MEILISTIAGLSTVIGSIFIFINIKKEYINKFITFSLALSLTIMLTISITELVPLGAINILKEYKLPSSLIIILISPIMCLKLIKYIDKISTNTNNLYKLGILNMIVLISHNIPEGIITYLSSLKDTALGIKICISIMLHNIPEGIAIAVPIYYSTRSKIKSVGMTLVAGLSEPFGAIITSILLKNYITNNILSITLYLVGIIMIVLSINKLYPEAAKLKEPKYISIGMITGIILFIILSLIA